MTRAEWLRVLYSTELADRPQAEAAVVDLHRAAGLQEPRFFLWFDSPIAAASKLKTLIRAHDSFLSFGRLNADQTTLEYLCNAVGELRLEDAIASIGKPLGPATYSKFVGAIGQARTQAYPEFRGYPLFRCDDDDLERAETYLLSRSLGVLEHVLQFDLLDWSLQRAYSISNMAADESNLGPNVPPPLLDAAWRIARSAGLCFCFERATILIDRPTQIHVNRRLLLHRRAGPAVVYRDGSEIFALNGQWLPESAFRKLAVPRSKVSKARSSTILTAELPATPEARLAMLRDQAGGHLPLYERYVAGECKRVWAELVGMNFQIREDPHASDALAVAFETMRRVEVNVRTVTARLTAIGYEFKTTPHVPAGPLEHRNIRKLERKAGPIPISLRAFYEIVGAVNWTGYHVQIAPDAAALAPDPLVVIGVTDVLASWDSIGDRDGIVIAPDALHKADVSGGDPYQIAISDAGADGELRNERHHLFFVEYLRLCFRWGGFPGWDASANQLPHELQELRSGLLDF